MTVEREGEFFVRLADNDDATSKVDTAYPQALRAAASDAGSLSQDVANVLVETRGLGDNDTSAVSGFDYGYQPLHSDSISNLNAFSVLASFRTLQPRRISR